MNHSAIAMRAHGSLLTDESRVDEVIVDLGYRRPQLPGLSPHLQIIWPGGRTTLFPLFVLQPAVEQGQMEFGQFAAECTTDDRVVLRFAPPHTPSPKLVLDLAVVSIYLRRVAELSAP